MQARLFAQVIALFVTALLAAQAAAQGGAGQDDDFSSDAAIVDTALPFALGARQAEQQLRGAFGWATFQEGVVEGIYFRFDPDGYARFSPSSRLDADVFEVTCRPRTRSCVATKGPLTVYLDEGRRVRLAIDEIAEGDRFFIREGPTEIEVPARIVGPLEMQLELLLGTGGELITRRGTNETHRISLAGFHAVVNYLRWVVSGQDYSVLSPGWPMPTLTAGDPGIARASIGFQPRPPQPATGPLTARPAPAAATGQDQSLPGNTAGVLLACRAVAAQDPGAAAARPECLAAFAAAAGSVSATSLPSGPAPTALAPPAPFPRPPSASGTQSAEALDARLARLEASLATLARRIAPEVQPGADPGTVEIGKAALPSASAPPGSGLGHLRPGTPVQPANAAMTTPRTFPADSADVAPRDQQTLTTAERLAFLIEEIGLEPQAALMLIGMQGQIGAGSDRPGNATPPDGADIVDEVLRELSAGTVDPGTVDPPGGPDGPAEGAGADLATGAGETGGEAAGPALDAAAAAPADRAAAGGPRLHSSVAAALSHAGSETAPEDSAAPTPSDGYLPLSLYLERLGQR